MIINRISYLLKPRENRLFAFSTVLMLFVFAPNAMNPCQTMVEKLLEESTYLSSDIGIFITDLGDDSTIVSINADRGFNPASITKLVTGAAAFELLGMDYRFKTKVYIDSPFNRDSGTVNGNLYIYGGGDPGFLAERMWLFVQHLSHQGLKRISNDLVLDDTFFDTVTCGPGFDEDNSSRAYEALTSALSASFNSVAVHVAPGGTVGSPVHVQPFPEISGVSIISTAKTTKAGSPSIINVKTEKLDGKTAILVYGGMNIDEKPKYIYRKVWETWENFGWVLQGLFKQSGITLSGSVRHEAIPDSIKLKTPFYTFESQPLVEFINHMFKYSSNFAAEMIFKTISAENDSSHGSWEKGGKLISSWWEKQKLPGKPAIVNGSGMGNRNLISPAELTGLLKYVWNKKTYTADYVSALSIAGVDGTLEHRFSYSPLKGFVRGKTGTLNNYGVSNLAGYIFLPEKTFAFVIFINKKGPAQFSHWTIQEKILETAIQSSCKK